MYLGRFDETLSPWQAVRRLFSPGVPDGRAVRDFLALLFHRRQSGVVRSRGVHHAVFAPTGAGKGVNLVVPHLLACDESMVVLDFKGELARLTGPHRERRFRHRAVYLDPFRLFTDRPDTWNVLDTIGADASAADDCRDIGEELVVRTGEEHDSHWLDSASLWLSALIALVASEPGRDQSLQMVRKILTAHPDAAVDVMQRSGAWDGLIARWGNQLARYVDREKGSVLTTANRMLAFLDTPAVVESTSRSTFDPAGLNGGRMTVFLIVPPFRRKALSGLLRVWVGCLTRTVMKGGLRG